MHRLVRDDRLTVVSGQEPLAGFYHCQQCDLFRTPGQYDSTMGTFSQAQDPGTNKFPHGLRQIRRRTLEGLGDLPW